jgi:hypothetical protein
MLNLAATSSATALDESTRRDTRALERGCFTKTSRAPDLDLAGHVRPAG